MKSKLKVLLPLLLVLAAGGGGAYVFLLAPGGSAKKPPPPKVDGILFALSPEFVVNLADNHFGKVSVALLLKAEPVLDPTSVDTPKLTQDAAVRATVTDDLTGLSTDSLVDPVSRHRLEAKILNDLTKTTDVEVTRVLFTDLVVQ